MVSGCVGEASVSMDCSCVAISSGSGVSGGEEYWEGGAESGLGGPKRSFVGRLAIPPPSGLEGMVSEWFGGHRVYFTSAQCHNLSKTHQ